MWKPNLAASTFRHPAASCNSISLASMPEAPIPAPSGNPRSPCRDDRTESGRGISAMNAILFGGAAGQRIGKKPGANAAEWKREKPLNAAWLVLEAANDLGDHATVEIC